MNNQKNYEINGLLKAGLHNGIQPIYIMIPNQIRDIQQVTLKMSQYLQQINPFNPFIWIICNQQTLPLDIKEVKQILTPLCKNIPQQQLERINKLIVISDMFQPTQLQQAIPNSAQTILNQKSNVIMKLNQLIHHDIKLSKNQIDFLDRLNNTYQDELPFYGRDISEYPIAPSGIPEFLETILQYYERNDNYLHRQGVFRLSGSVQQEQKLVSEFLVQNYSAVDQFESDVVSTVLKNALTNLKKPIFPFEMYSILKETQINTSREKLLEMFQVFFAYMPEVNRNTTKRLAEFLYKVASYKEENLMGLENLSIVFAPCFLRSEQIDMSDYMGAKVVVNHFNLLVQNVDWFLQLRQQPQRRSISQSLK